jgi:cell pole-organizing protein PopZ
MATAETEITSTMRLHELRISNFMGITALTVDADGHHVIINGKNASGKTTSVEAIWCALKGASQRAVPEPIHAGADRAQVELDLGDYLVERTWTEGGSRLVVRAADGSKVGKPQDLLDGFVATYTLDPMAFLERRPCEQVDDVLSVCGVAPPVKAVAELTGEEFPLRGGESADAYLMRLSADETGIFYVRRRETGRVIDQKRGALKDERRVLEGLGGEPHADEKPCPVSDLVRQLEELNAVGDRRRAALGAVERARHTHAEAAARMAKIQGEHAQCGRDIEQLEQQLARKRAEQAELAERIEKGTTVCAELSGGELDAAKAAEAIGDPTPELARLRDKLRTAEAENEGLTKRRHAAEQTYRLAKELEHSEAEHKKLDEILAGLRSLRAHLLEGFDLGVDGLAVGDGELRLNDVTFRQASMAEQIDVACAIAMRQKPKLRLLRLDGAERLDAETMRRVLRLADERDFQVIMTRVAEDEKLRVEIVDQVMLKAG